MRRLQTLFALLLAGCLAHSAAAAPSYVTWKTSVVPHDVRAGEGAQIVVSASIRSPWHLYSLTQTGGPTPTTITLAPAGDLVPVGAPVQSAPKKVHDAGFNITVEIYEKAAAFAIPVKIKAGAKGVITAHVKVHYQLCNAESCMPPDTVNLTVAFKPAPGPARPARTKPVKATPKAAAELTPTLMGTLVLAGGPSSGGAPPDAYAARIARAEGNGLFAFVRLSMAAGFLALLTPCVFPMIPITVSFFTKRREGPRGRGVIGAAAYCVGIVVTFTGLGLLMSALFGASGISRFAANPYVNVCLAALFVLLAANLLGAFEVALPSALVNRVNSGSRRGGLWEPLLMGLTFTLTSFTCTAPFVGTLLVAATRGSTFYPLLGMAAFSTAFALPFFVLALFPQLLASLPRSGSWLVSVKAVMGLLELAAAVKFLSNADLVWERGLLTRPVFLAVWASIASIAGLYLLGWVRFSHDGDGTRIGWIRRSFGVAGVGVALYCLAAIQGASLGEFDSFVPPSVYPGRVPVAQGSQIAGANPADSAVWLTDYAEAAGLARARNRPLLINFTGVTCTNCRWMEKNIFTRAEVVRELGNFVKVELYTDRDTPADAQNKNLEEKLTQVVTLPVYVALSPEGKVTRLFQGLTRNPQEFVSFLRQGRSSELTTAMR